MKRNGFTLTELIAVFVIIGLVIIVAIPVSNSIMKNNEKERAMLYVETLEKAVITYCDLYYDDSNTECSVSYGTLKDKNLIKDYSYKNITANIKLSSILKIDDSEVKIGNSELEIDNSELEIVFKKNNVNLYMCTKTNCELCTKTNCK